MSRQSPEPEIEIDGEADLRLVRRAASGELLARRELARRLLARVRRTVYFLAPGDPDHEDLVQQALVEIICSSESFRGSGRLESWADSISVRTVRRQLRRRQQERHLFRPGDVDETAGPADGARALRRSRLQRELARLLGELTVERRTVVVLRLVFRYSIPEIAEMTESPVNTVRDRLRVGRKQLRERLQSRPHLAALLEEPEEGSHA